MLGAQDALAKTKGEGDFFEHLWSLTFCLIFTLLSCFQQLKVVQKNKASWHRYACRIWSQCPHSASKSAIVGFFSFLLQFTNLLMVLLMITGTLCSHLVGLLLATEQTFIWVSCCSSLYS